MQLTELFGSLNAGPAQLSMGGSLRKVVEVRRSRTLRSRAGRREMCYRRSRWLGSHTAGPHRQGPLVPAGWSFAHPTRRWVRSILTKWPRYRSIRRRPAGGTRRLGRVSSEPLRARNIVASYGLPSDLRGRRRPRPAIYESSPLSIPLTPVRKELMGPKYTRTPPFAQAFPSASPTLYSLLRPRFAIASAQALPSRSSQRVLAPCVFAVHRTSSARRDPVRSPFGGLEALGRLLVPRPCTS